MVFKNFEESTYKSSDFRNLNKDLEKINLDILERNCNNMTSPEISAIIPVYNTGKYLKQCLDSVCNQTFKDIEIICINDGSTDGSLDILKEYEHKDLRIKIIINQKNEGAGAARNKGIETARGQYIAFVDSDDWIDLSYYEVLYNMAKSYEADLIRTSYILEYSDYSEKEKFFSSLFEKKRKRGEPLFLNVNDHSCVVYNAIYRYKYLIKNNVHFDNSYHCNDIFFTAQAVYFSQKTIGLDSNVYYHKRCNIPNQLSVTTKANLLERTKSLIRCNRITLEFINSAKYKTRQDYVAAYERCLWRYDNFFKRSLIFDEFREDLQKKLFSDFAKAFKNFKYKKNLFSQKSYYSFVKSNDFNGYVKFVKQNINADKIIVSLTSYPARINIVHRAISTLLNQTKKADKIILWLAEEDFPSKEQELPKDLLELTKEGLIIDWCKDIKSYNKLIPTLRKYPNYTIVTVDDDTYYPKDLIEKLYKAYLNQPNMVHCHRAHGITFKFGKINPYLKWDFSLCGDKVKPSFCNFLTGVGGVLYPPGIFYKDIFREDLIKKLCLFGDDIWFWAMCVLNNVKINVIKGGSRFCKTIENSQNRALWYISSQGRNDEYLQNMFRYYPQLLKKIRKYSIPYKQYIQCLFSVYNETSHKVVKIFGLKIKLRKEKVLKIRKNITKFLEHIFCIKNEGVHKIFGIFNIKIKVKRKYQILLASLKYQEKCIKNLQSQVKLQNDLVIEALLEQTDDFKKVLTEKIEVVDKKIANQSEGFKNILTEKIEVVDRKIANQSEGFKKVLTEKIEVVDKKIANQSEGFKKREKLNYSQIESFFWLTKKLKIHNNLPPLRNWAMSPDILLKLHEYIIFSKPKVIVEFGSGVSTLVICDALRQNNSGYLISVEHMEQYAQRTMQFIKRENLQNFVDLRLSELEIYKDEHLCINESVQWYCKETLKDIKNIDLLIVDGPPAATCKYARYPAVPVLYENLNRQAQIWMDDAVREDENVICKTWAQKYDLNLNFLDFEKGLAILIKK
ncbi:MAG: glycosyltransferase [Endomicrobium sp.]|nr:glycosyltransferase [Endomicrobium sp.]